MQPEPLTMKPSSQIAGVAGEYFVAAELSRRGFIASITMRNTRGIDILGPYQPLRPATPRRAKAKTHLSRSTAASR